MSPICQLHEINCCHCFNNDDDDDDDDDDDETNMHDKNTIIQDALMLVIRKCTFENAIIKEMGKQIH